MNIFTKAKSWIKKPNSIVMVSLFLLSFISYWSFLPWKLALLIIISIGIHELGHLWAMHKTGMKSKGLFFIPFWGGGVVPDSPYRTYAQHVFISIMGPLWGVISAIPLAIGYQVTHNTMLGGAAWLIVLFNGFNLIPALPLDGGHILKSISFSLRPKVGVAILTTVTVASMAASVPILGAGWAALIFVLGAIQLFVECYFLLKRDQPGFKWWNVPPSLRDKPVSMNRRQMLQSILAYCSTVLVLCATWWLVHDVNVKEGLAKYFK